MRLWSDSFSDGGVIPAACAFASIDRGDPAAHVRLSTNRNPHLAWDDVPTGTESLVLLCRDIDASTRRGGSCRWPCRAPIFITGP